MKVIWWEASGHATVALHGGHMIKTSCDIRFQAGEEFTVAYPEAVYTLALKGAEGMENIIAMTVAATNLLPRPDLPSDYYMNTLSEGFQEKGLVDCAYELAEYTKHEIPEISESATFFLRDALEALTYKDRERDMPPAVEEWFVRDAPEGEPFDEFRREIAIWKGQAL